MSVAGVDEVVEGHGVSPAGDPARRKSVARMTSGQPGASLLFPTARRGVGGGPR